MKYIILAALIGLTTIQTFSMQTNLVSTDVQECPICLEDFKAGEQVNMLPCHKNHIYHNKCLTLAFDGKTAPKCPLCNTEVKANIDRKPGSKAFVRFKPAAIKTIAPKETVTVTTSSLPTIARPAEIPVEIWETLSAEDIAFNLVSFDKKDKPEDKPKAQTADKKDGYNKFFAAAREVAGGLSLGLLMSQECSDDPKAKKTVRRIMYIPAFIGCQALLNKIDPDRTINQKTISWSLIGVLSGMLIPQMFSKQEENNQN